MPKTGYASTEYAQVYENENSQIFGFPYENFLKNKIPNTEYYDYCNVYPFLANNYHWLADDFDKNAVSSVLITNPLREVVINRSMELEVYKEHSIVNLKDYDLSKISEGHRRNIKKSSLEIKVHAEPLKILDIVIAYKNDLKERHGITGITDYTKEQLAKLISVPGTFLFTAQDGSYYCNTTLFYVQDNDVYMHFSYQGQGGIEKNANFKMIHQACMFFKQLGLDRLLLGSVPDGGNSGLSRFKKGFASELKNNYIIKTIINKELYSKLSENKTDGFFPSYRYRA